MIYQKNVDQESTDLKSADQTIESDQKIEVNNQSEIISIVDVGQKKIHKKKVSQKKASKNFKINLMTIRKWHWMSSAICFICMLLFSVTGITLNHAGSIEASPKTTHLEGQVPEKLLNEIVLVDQKEDGNQKNKKQKTMEVPAAILHWFGDTHKLNFSNTQAEINDTELYLALPRPGGDAWLSLDTETGKFEYESTSRGWISYFNDLHKGRNTGKAWIYFMDVFALACIIFSITGFLLLQRYADTRSQTWPLLIAGLVIPILFMLFLIHS